MIKLEVTTGSTKLADWSTMRRTIAVATTVLLAAAGLAACSSSGSASSQSQTHPATQQSQSSGSSVATKSGSPVKVGIVTPLTGSAAAYGSGFWVGVQAAQKAINDAGGIVVDGVSHQVQATVCDDQFVPAKSLACGKKLSSSLMVYTPATQSSFPLMGFNQKDHFILMATSQTPSFTTSGNKLVVRSTYDLALAGGAIAKLTKAYGEKVGSPIKSVAIMQVDSDFGPAFTKSFDTTWKQSGGTITGTASYDTSTTDLTSQLTNLLKAKPDAIAITTECQSAALLMDQARQLGFKGTFINAVCAGGTGLTSYMNNPKQIGKNIAIVKANALDQIPVVAAFHKKYTSKADVAAIQQGILAFGYFGIEWLAKAAELAGTVTDANAIHAKFADALSKLQPNILGITKYFPETGDIAMGLYAMQTQPDGTSTLPLGTEAE